MVIFHSKLLVHQRVSMWSNHVLGFGESPIILVIIQVPLPLIWNTPFVHVEPPAGWDTQDLGFQPLGHAKLSFEHRCESSSRRPWKSLLLEREKKTIETRGRQRKGRMKRNEERRRKGKKDRVVYLWPGAIFRSNGYRKGIARSIANVASCMYPTLYKDNLSYIASVLYTVQTQERPSLHKCFARVLTGPHVYIYIHTD